MSIHLHISETARDCDGGHGRYYVDRRSLDEYFRIWDIPFSEQGTFRKTTRTDDETDESLTTLYFSTPTEEGFSSIEIQECADTYCEDDSSQYDQYAEMAGY